MPLNGFSVGKDVVLDIVGTGGIQNFSLITGFSSKQETTSIQIMGLDGVLRPLELPKGWTGEFDIERQNSVVDDYFAGLESSYYGGVNIQSASITETISEPTGAVTQYRYTGVSLKLTDAGAWKGDASVKQKLSFVAGRRLKVQ
ncbi:MAG: hypothetical protein P4M09_16895 [Devosia sp.]|nr:hypothetical protein [Devosia sp.]